MGLFLERLTRGEIGDEVSLDDLSGLMVEDWGKPTPPIGSTERNEALNRLEAYRRAGLLATTRGERYKAPGAVLMAGVQVPEQELTRFWVNRESALQALKTANDPATHAPGIALWLGDGDSLSEAHNQNPSDEVWVTAKRLIELLKPACKTIPDLIRKATEERNEWFAACRHPNSPGKIEYGYYRTIRALRDKGKLEGEPLPPDSLEKPRSTLSAVDDFSRKLSRGG